MDRPASSSLPQVWGFFNLSIEEEIEFDSTMAEACGHFTSHKEINNFALRKFKDLVSRNKNIRIVPGTGFDFLLYLRIVISQLRDDDKNSFKSLLSTLSMESLMKTDLEIRSVFK